MSYWCESCLCNKIALLGNEAQLKCQIWSCAFQGGKAVDAVILPKSCWLEHQLEVNVTQALPLAFHHRDDRRGRRGAEWGVALWAPRPTVGTSPILLVTPKICCRAADASSSRRCVALGAVASSGFSWDSSVLFGGVWSWLSCSSWWFRFSVWFQCGLCAAFKPTSATPRSSDRLHSRVQSFPSAVSWADSNAPPIVEVLLFFIRGILNIRCRSS